MAGINMPHYLLHSSFMFIFQLRIDFLVKSFSSFNIRDMIRLFDFVTKFLERS